MKRLRSRVELLSQSEIEMIHNASLRLLERTGMRVPNRTVCRLAQALGAKVDEHDMIVRLPRAMMEELLEAVRRNPGEAGRKDDAVSRLTGNVSTQIFMVDQQAGTRRYGTMEDLRDGIALIQSLDNIPLANAVVVPHDVPEAVSDVLSYQTADGRKAIVRPSGTEPKVKVYLSARAATRAEAEEALNRMEAEMNGRILEK